MRFLKLSLVSLILALAPMSYAQETKATAPKVEVKAPAPATQPAAAAPTAVAVPSVSQPAPVSTSSTAVTASTTTTEEMLWWKVLIRYGLELVFSLLGIMATVLVTVLMKKYGFEDYSAKVNSILERGAGYAEQKSLQALKLNGKPLASAEKLVVALDFMAEKAKEYKLPDKGKEWWTKKVEGWLGVQTLQNPKPVNGTTPTA